MPKQKKAAIISLVIMILITLMPVDAFAGTITYKVTFDCMGGSAIEGSPFTVKKGYAVKEPVPPTNGELLFRGWYTEHDTFAYKHKWNFNDPIASNITLYAKWVQRRTVTVIPGEHGRIDGYDKDYQYGEGDTLTLTAVPDFDDNHGYGLLEWTEDGVDGAVCDKVIYNTTVTGDVTIRASFIELGAPSEASASAPSFACISLSWTQVSGANGYDILRSTMPGGEGDIAYKTVNGGSVLSYNDTSVTIGTTYYYKIRAKCKAGSTVSLSSSASSEISAAARNSKPSVKASNDGYYSIKLSWDYMPSADGYLIYRSTSKDISPVLYKKIDSRDTYYYTDSGLNAMKGYYYKVRAYKGSVYSEYSDLLTVLTKWVAPTLSAAPYENEYENDSVRLTWKIQSGVDGYVLYRSDSLKGEYKKIYTAHSSPTAVYINGLDINSESELGDKTYYYKIRSYHKSGSVIKYSSYSDAVSSNAKGEDNRYSDPDFALYKQGDIQWGLSKNDASNACLLTSYAIVIQNMGIPCTPKTLYQSNGNDRHMNFTNTAANFGVKRACAISRNSVYFDNYDGTGTFIKNPKKYAETAIKEAINLNPEGVIVYFRNSRHMHAFVACYYQGDHIYYSDPAFSNFEGGLHTVTFKDTWVSWKYHMTYADFWQFRALNKIN